MLSLSSFLGCLSVESHELELFFFLPLSAADQDVADVLGLRVTDGGEESLVV